MRCTFEDLNSWLGLSYVGCGYEGFQNGTSFRSPRTSLVSRSNNEGAQSVQTQGAERQEFDTFAMPPMDDLLEAANVLADGEAVVSEDENIEARVSDDGEAVVSDWEDETSPDEGTASSPKALPKLYSEAEVASTALRFSVGDEVLCNIGDGESAHGVVVRRFYREDEWPRGYYAAVRML